MALTEDHALSSEDLDEAPALSGSQMMVRKRNGDLEPVDLNRSSVPFIVAQRACRASTR